MLCCPHPTKIWKLGRSVWIFFFFFFFYVLWESWVFQYFFKSFQMGKTRAECSQNAYTSHASAFLSHWIQILANSSPKSDIKKKQKKTWPCFFAFYGRSGEGNINFFFFLALAPCRRTQKLAIFKFSRRFIMVYTQFTSGGGGGGVRTHWLARVDVIWSTSSKVSVTSPWTPPALPVTGVISALPVNHRVGLSLANLILKMSRVNDRRSLWGKLLSSMISYHWWLGSVWT